MKVTVDVDCTPEEARRFLGLPDLGPVHEAYVEKMKAAMADGAGTGPEALAEMMKAWGPMSEAGMNMWRQMLEPMTKRRLTDTIFACRPGAPPAAIAVVRISGARAAAALQALAGTLPEPRTARLAALQHDGELLDTGL